MEVERQCSESEHLTDDEAWEIWQRIQDSPKYRADAEADAVETGTAAEDAAGEPVPEAARGVWAERVARAKALSEEVQKAREKIFGKGKPLPMVRKYIAGLVKKFDGYLGGRDKAYSGLLQLVKCLDDLDDEDKNSLIRALENLGDRCQVMIDALRGEGVKLLPLNREVKGQARGEVIEHDEQG
jgi:hypothetical protein